MKKIVRKLMLAIVAVNIIAQLFIYKIDTVNAETIVSSNTMITLSGDTISDDSTTTTVYLTINSTNMSSGLAGYYARIYISPCQSTYHGYIYGGTPTLASVDGNYVITSNFSRME